MQAALDWILQQLSDGTALRVAVTVVLLAILLSPVLRYLFDGWKAKKHELLSYFDEDIAQEYFKQFAPTEEVPAGFACKALERIYDNSLGRKLFITPLVILTAIAFFGAWAASGTGLHMIGLLPKVGLQLPHIALAAVAGAYMWVANDFIWRMRRRDLGPSDLFTAALRLAIAIPLGYAFATVAADDVGPFIAFALGAFPLGPLTVILRRLASKQLGIEDKGDEASDHVTRLQGVNRDIAERFEQSDIFTISQLSEADPVALSRRTNLGLNFILDCMSQSLAWNYLGSKLDALRPLGLRGAYEIRNFVQALDGTGEWADIQSDQARASKALPHIATVAATQVEALQIPLREIAEDPYTIFIHKIFH